MIHLTVTNPETGESWDYVLSQDGSWTGPEEEDLGLSHEEMLARLTNLIRAQQRGYTDVPVGGQA